MGGGWWGAWVWGNYSAAATARRTLSSYTKRPCRVFRYGRVAAATMTARVRARGHAASMRAIGSTAPPSALPLATLAAAGAGMAHAPAPLPPPPPLPLLLPAAVLLPSWRGLPAGVLPPLLPPPPRCPAAIATGGQAGRRRASGRCAAPQHAAPAVLNQRLPPPPCSRDGNSRCFPLATCSHWCCVSLAQLLLRCAVRCQQQLPTPEAGCTVALWPQMATNVYCRLLLPPTTHQLLPLPCRRVVSAAAASCIIGSVAPCRSALPGHWHHRGSSS